MKYCIFVLIFITVFAFAVDPMDCGTTMNPAPGQPATDAYTITVVNTFQCPYSSIILGLDCPSLSSSILFMDNINDKLWVANIND